MIHLRSMRTRMSLGFVLVLAPFLIVASHLVLLAGGNAHADQTKTELIRTQKRALYMLTTSQGWQQELTSLFDQQQVREKQIGALVVDNYHGHVIWRSNENSPKWPPAEGSTLRTRQGPFTLHVSLPDAVFEHQRQLHALFLLSGAAVIAFALGSWLMVGRTLSPIRDLASQAANASADDVGARLTSPSQDIEMRELVATLNDFLGRMEEASQQRSRFYAAASHELRTPLQALSGHLEVALAQPRDASEYQAGLREAHVQTQRLVSLVEGILLLHRVQGSTSEQRTPACLTLALEETLASLQPLIEARGLRLDVDLAPDQSVSSVPMHLNVLVRNLLENAARYGLEGGALSVRLANGRLTIENDVAPGFHLDPDRLFEPFHRSDASRSVKSGGNGLGLAICHAVAKTNGWALSLTQEGDQVRAVVDFA